MKTVGVIGLGNMGMGMARNLLAKGFAVRGYDLRPEVRQTLADAGGIAASGTNDVAQGAKAIFLMVMSATQVDDIVNGGLLDAMEPGATLIVTATIGAASVQKLARQIQAKNKNLGLIDAPVSGGKAGADGGTLTLMASGAKAVMEANDDILKGIGSTIIPVGEKPSQGQVIKACLQALIGVSFEGVFEAMVLGAQAGVDLQVLLNVINNSLVGSRLTALAGGHAAARRFRDTGSHISTMVKDIGISMEMADELQVPMPATDVAMKMFKDAYARIPEGDNWCIVELLESMAKEQRERNKK